MLNASRTTGVVGHSGRRVEHFSLGVVIASVIAAALMSGLGL
jgi:hypothetical protein